MAAIDGRLPGAELARYYDLDLLEEPGDLDLYLAMAARTSSPILELGIGSGRIAVPLALAGHRVTGVDVDPAMLERARSRWEASRGRRPRGRLELVEADMRDADLEGRYALAILALNALLLLPDRDAQAAALRTCALHLAPGGLAIVDVALPGADDLAACDGRLTLDWVREDPETGELVTRTSSARYDAASASVDLVQVFDAVAPGGGPLRRTIRRDRLQLLSAAHLLDLVGDAGLAVEQAGGDHLLTPFGPGSTRVVLVTRSL